MTILKNFLDSPFARGLCFASSILGLIIGLPSLLNKAGGTAKKAIPVSIAAERSDATMPVPETSRRSVVQSSSGAQNVNVANVQHSVQIQYSEPTKASNDLIETSLPVVSASVSPGSTIQTAHGVQNANVSRVGGKVDIRYGAAAVKERIPDKQ